MSRTLFPSRRAIVTAALLTTLLSLPPAAHGITVNETRIPDTLTLGDQLLTLNGTGVRNKYFMDLYVGALYLPHAETDAAIILAADTPMALRLNILSDRITSERMRDSSLEGFEHATHGKTAPLQREIEAFLDAYREPIHAGDVFELRYTPAHGTDVVKNDRVITTIKGLSFKQALFGIWLCDEPAQTSLREGLLGHLDE
jgi:hypothetical protein